MRLLKDARERAHARIARENARAWARRSRDRDQRVNADPQVIAANNGLDRTLKFAEAIHSHRLAFLCGVLVDAYFKLRWIDMTVRQIAAESGNEMVARWAAIRKCELARNNDPLRGAFRVQSRPL